VLGFDAKGNFYRGAEGRIRHGQTYRAGVLGHDNNKFRISDSAHFLYTTLPKIEKEKLINSTWKFYNDSGFVGNVIFNASGKIGGYANGINETSWMIDAADGSVCLLHANGTVYTRFYNNTLNTDGKWILQGIFYYVGNWRHYMLEQ